MFNGAKIYARKKLLTVFVYFFGLGGFALSANSTKVVPYKSGEKVSYAITYYGATAGILDLEVLPPITIGEKKYNELLAKARTDAVFALFYRFQNKYRSTVEVSTGLPMRFLISHDEAKFGGTVTQEFDQKKHEVRHLDRREDRNTGKKIEKEFLKEILPATQDVVSVFYHLRSLPLEKGKFFDVPVFVGEESLLIRVEVTEEETLPTKLGDMPTYVLKPSLLKEGKPTEIPDTFIWIAKDKNRAMVKFKAKVKIGSVVGYLLSYSPGS